MYLWSLFAFLVLSLSPSAHAEDQMINLQDAQPMTQGIERSAWEGTMFRTERLQPGAIMLFQLPRPLHASTVESITIPAMAGQPRAQFLWSTDRGEITNVFHTDIQQHGNDWTVQLATADSWSGRITHIGFGFPQGAAGLRVNGLVQVNAWTTGEKLTAFLEPEPLSLASINVLHGSTWGNTPFVQLVGLAYICGALLILVAGWFCRWQRGNLTEMLSAYALLCFATYDLRFSYDLAALWEDSYTRYASKPAATRSFADHGDFYSFMSYAAEQAEDESVAFYPKQYPFVGKARYLLHPRPLDEQARNASTIVVYDAPNVRFENGTLTIDGQTICSDCEEKKFRSGAAVYRSLAAHAAAGM